MANYSVNQNRQVYIANNGYSTASSPAAGTVTKIVKDAEANNFYFLFKGADTILKSDYISLDGIKVKAIDAAKNGTYMKKIYVTVTADAIVGGQDYVLGINFRNFFSSGDSSQYYKDAVVHGVQGMSKSDFYKAMVAALNAAFAREDGATKTSNPYLAFSVDNNSTATKIIIEEKEQEWALGTKKARRIMFDVLPSTIYTGGDDVIWGTVTEETTAGNLTFVPNTKKIADLEWFAMGERGDQYRNVGWPNVIPTTYLVDYTKQYHLLEFHYAFTDTGVNSYRSEKELTIAVPKGAGADNYTAINALITAINSATGLSIATLS